MGKKEGIGTGKNMSIPKAALVWFFEAWEKGKNMKPEGWDIGEYGAAHEIIDIAGARHDGAFTSPEVSRSLSRSKLWNKRREFHLYRGYRGGTAHPNVYTPSDKGKKWFYEEYKSKQS